MEPTYLVTASIGSKDHELKKIDGKNFNYVLIDTSKVNLSTVFSLFLVLVLSYKS